MIRFEFGGSLRETHDHGVDGARDRAVQDGRQHEAGEEAEASDDGPVVALAHGGIGEPIPRRIRADAVPDRRAEAADDQRQDKEDVPHEVVGDDRLPATILEEGHDALTGLDVAVPVQSHVDEGPLVEVFEQAAYIFVSCRRRKWGKRGGVEKCSLADPNDTPQPSESTRKSKKRGKTSNPPTLQSSHARK